MNLYLVEIFIKFLRILFIAFISLFNISIYAEKENVAQNTIINQKNYAVNNVVLKEEPKVVKNEVKSSTNNTNKNTNIIVNKNTSTNNNTVKQEVIEQKETNTIETFTGRLTGYGPDCAGCSTYGNLACKTREKKTFSLKTDGVYYTDSEYGKLRIIAAATTKFKCGTVLTITTPGQQPFMGIVLDTGGTMRKEWANGRVWMDLAYESETMAGSDKLTGYNVKFEVNRYGW